MSFNSFKKLSIILAVLALTVITQGRSPVVWQGWQGTGNMSGSNMTEIHSTIINIPIVGSTTNAQIDSVGRTISTYLNTLWA